MTSKIVQPDFWADTNPVKESKKPYKYITQDEFIDFVKDSLASLFASNSKLIKLNEYLILNILECQDKVIEHEEVIKELKNP